jgi:hypothetical protein
MHVVQFITTRWGCYLICSPLKRGDSVCRLQGNLRAASWKNKQEMYILSNMHIPPAEGSFGEGGKAVKPLIIKDCTFHMGLDLSDKMVNSYSMSKRT